MENRENDRLYMHRCLQLAACGRGRVSPNPMVGAVIVCDGRIIGEGYHRQFGGPHAEVNAVNSVRESGLLARSTLYVSLEPCSHYGKTPPCCRLIIEKRYPASWWGVSTHSLRFRDGEFLCYGRPALRWLPVCSKVSVGN